MEEVHNCVVKLRSNPQRNRNKVYVGCGAGFGGDRPIVALKLLERVKELNYLVLECLAERTLADCYQTMAFGGNGYDPRGGIAAISEPLPQRVLARSGNKVSGQRICVTAHCTATPTFCTASSLRGFLCFIRLTIKEWLSVLLPLALDREVCIITNMEQWIHLEHRKKYSTWHLIWD